MLTIVEVSIDKPCWVKKILPFHWNCNAVVTNSISLLSICIFNTSLKWQWTMIFFKTWWQDICRGFIKFLYRRSVGFFSRAILVFLVKESKKRRRKPPGKLMAKSRSQPVNLPGAWPLINQLKIKSKVHQNITFLCIFWEKTHCFFYLNLLTQYLNP